MMMESLILSYLDLFNGFRMALKKAKFLNRGGGGRLGSIGQLNIDCAMGHGIAEHFMACVFRHT